VTSEVLVHEVDAAGDQVELGGVDGLDQPDHERHIDEHKHGRRSPDDKIDEHIECVLVFVVQAEVVFLGLDRLSPHYVPDTNY
jgi:hypothetical protein